MRFLIALTLATASSGAFAAGAALLQATDYLPTQQESSALSFNEAKLIATVRAEKGTRFARFVKMNTAALGSGVISVVLPDGSTAEIVGSAKTVPAPQDVTSEETAKVAHPDLIIWYGTGKNARAQFVINGQSVSGWVVSGARTFGFRGLDLRGRILMTESDPPARAPSTAPDAGPHALASPQPQQSRSTIQKMRPMAADPANPTINVLVIWSPGAKSAANALSYDRTAIITAKIDELSRIWNDLNSAGTRHVSTPIDPGLNIHTRAVYDSTNARLDGTTTSAVIEARADLSILRTRDGLNDADMVLVLNAGTSDGADGPLGYALVEGVVQARDAFVAIWWNTLRETWNPVLHGYPVAHTVGHLLGATHAESYQHRYQTTTTGSRWACFHTLDTDPNIVGFGGATCDWFGGGDVDAGYYSSKTSLSVPFTSPPSNPTTIGDLSHDNATNVMHYGGPVVGFRNSVLAPRRAGILASGVVAAINAND